MSVQLLDALKTFKVWSRSNDTSFQAMHSQLETITGSIGLGGTTTTATPQRDHHPGREGIDDRCATVEELRRKLEILTTQTDLVRCGQVLVADPRSCSNEGALNSLPRLLLGAVPRDVIVLRPGRYPCSLKLMKDGATIAAAASYVENLELRKPFVRGHNIAATNTTAITGSMENMAAPCLTVAESVKHLRVLGCVIGDDAAHPNPRSVSVVLHCCTANVQSHTPIPRRVAPSSLPSSIKDGADDGGIIFDQTHIQCNAGAAVHIHLTTCPRTHIDGDSEIVGAGGVSVVTFRHCVLSSTKGPCLRIRSNSSDDASSAVAHCSPSTSPSPVMMKIVVEDSIVTVEKGTCLVYVEGVIDVLHITFRRCTMRALTTLSSSSSKGQDEDGSTWQTTTDSVGATIGGGHHVVLVKALHAPPVRAYHRPLITLDKGCVMEGFDASIVCVEVDRRMLPVPATQHPSSQHRHPTFNHDGIIEVMKDDSSCGFGIPLVGCYC